ncbi:MAG: quaternary ammonium transporter [Chloroflexota bacterium]|nr:quaternary ammonium transporter [Chloroflexota bacterium]MDQ5864716.1 quaternary ammonium transporter [Chloroflexota bacterium]
MTGSRLMTASLLLLLVGALAACGEQQGDKRKIVVGSKDFTEAYLIGEMYALVLEAAGVPVERKLNLGSTAIAHEALLKGGAQEGIDLYPEYTGTGLQAVLEQPPNSDPQQTYKLTRDGYMEKWGLVWLDMAPMNDTQAVVTTQEVAQSRGLQSLDDMCEKAADLTIVARPEFSSRTDALPALQKIYGGCDFKEIKAVQSGDLLYRALLDGQADVAQADSTAGEIKGHNLVLLEDPRGYGGPYNIAPVVRQDALDLYPQLAGALNNLAPRITTEEISALNWEVSGKQREYEDVAREWLQKQGLLK